jgi:hypothetical protein
MKSRKLVVLFVMILFVSSPAGAWSFLLPYTQQAIAVLTPAWNLLTTVTHELALAIATNPPNYPKHL